jgi:hypothetical protein
VRLILWLVGTYDGAAHLVAEMTDAQQNAPRPMAGRLSEAGPATAEVQELVESVRAEIIAKLGWADDCGQLTAVGFKSQLVAGKLFYVKLMAAGQCVRWGHVRILCGLAGADSSAPPPELVKATAAEGASPIDAF